MAERSTVEEPRASAALIDLIYRRRSVRAYTTEIIDEHRMSALLDIAVHAPTARHEEPWRFVVVQNRAVLTRLSDRAKGMACAEAARHGNVLIRPGAAGDGVASPFADPEFNMFYDASTLVIIGATPVSAFVVADCWLAAENLMLAACAEGLGTCCIGLAVPVLNAPVTKAELGIPANVQVFAAIIVGVPRGDAPPSPRKPPVTLRWIH